MPDRSMTRPSSADAESAGVVAAAADRNPQLFSRPKRTAAMTSATSAHCGDQPRPAIDHGVVNFAGLS